MMEELPVLTLAFQGHSAGVRVRKAMAEHGLKPGHGHVLMVLQDEGAVGQHFLTETLGVDKSVIVALLNDLERDGLAERRRDPADRRRHIVEISPRGSTLVTELHRTVEAVQADLFRDLTPAEIATLKSVLPRLRTTPDAGTPCDGQD
ncbi:DNA-binding MarR family transcriptional regulator [Kitasatospora gansuensis]|uniref:DNA-binding MarR family transcriptional regulator n=2 Tax=Kitasatospora gansuensis TaxID=258050 RepID=A0A7W7SD95_9ACTN|nr:DNA-binding MarR family transcriptional regulator [Kitasatospora gansuensis]